MANEELITKLALEFTANYHQMNAADREIVARALDMAMTPLVTIEPFKVALNTVPNIANLKVIDVIQADNTQLEITNVRMFNKKITVFVK